MARLIKVVRVRGNLEAKVQGGLDGKLLIFREGNDLILRVELVSFEGSSYPGFVRIKYDNTPLSDIDNVITRYLATNPRNFQVIQVTRRHQWRRDQLHWLSQTRRELRPNRHHPRP